MTEADLTSQLLSNGACMQLILSKCDTLTALSLKSTYHHASEWFFNNHDLFEAMWLEYKGRMIPVSREIMRRDDTESEEYKLLMVKQKIFVKNIKTFMMWCGKNMGHIYVSKWYDGAPVTDEMITECMTYFKKNDCCE